MAGATQFPAALDVFPAIGPNTSEVGEGVEHDVVHENVHAAVVALQAKVGVDGSTDPASIDARVADAATRLDTVDADIDLLADGQLAHLADPDPHATPSVAVVNDAGVAVMDCAAGRLFAFAMDANATLVIANPPAADCMILRVVPSSGAVLALPGNAAMLDGSAYVGGPLPHVLGFITFDGGASFGVVVVQQP